MEGEEGREGERKCSMTHGRDGGRDRGRKGGREGGTKRGRDIGCIFHQPNRH